MFKDIDYLMEVFEQLFPWEKHKNGGSISVSRTRYEHSGKLGWVIFVHTPSGHCYKFDNIEELDAWFAHYEILFRKY